MHVIAQNARGLLVVVSGPSGVGKTTILNSLLGHCPNCVFSTSATTRAPRPGELDGVHYFFYDRVRFASEVEDGEFLEWAEFCGNLYGTPRRAVVSGINEGKTVILDIEATGASEVKQKLPEAVTIFILPPSLDELVRRMSGRGTETKTALRERIQSVATQIASIGIYDYIVINDSVEAAVERIQSIIVAELCRIDRYDVATIIRGAILYGKHDETLT